MSCTGTAFFSSSVVQSVTCDKEATGLVAVCMYISCAVLAAVQLESHFQNLSRSLLSSEFTLWWLGRTKEDEKFA